MKFSTMEKNCKNHLDYPDRGSYRVKWILQTAMVMTVFYTILWYYFPRYEVIEKIPMCPSIIPEIVC